MAARKISLIRQIVDDKSPLYRRIYDSIRSAILSGKLKSGERLPASRALAVELGVSRMTVINAYDQLFAEGYLEGRRGSGTFVASHLPEEFLRVQVQARSSAKSNDRVRKLLLSTYGKELKRNSVTISDHHSAGMIMPFQHSAIAAEEFPFGLWAKLSQKHFRYSYKQIGSYGDAAGYPPLRKAIAQHLRATRGVQCEDEQVVVTAGTQQAIFLIASVLLSTGDKVWVEDPCHLGASDVLTAIGADVSHIPVDDDGFDLQRANKEKKNARMIYVTPSRQFPLGITMSLQRRLSLLEWAKERDAWIIEDDYDSEFRYSGRPLPALQGLDRDNRVLYVGTFSKTVFPGLRLGCVVVPPDLVDVFTSARALIDLHAPITDQMVLADFISEGHFERHVRRMRTLYHERQTTLVEELKKHLGGFVEVENSDAGMHIIGWLAVGVDDKAISKTIAENGLRVAPVSRYAKLKLKLGGLLLGYTAFSSKEIRRGVKDLAKVVNKIKP